MTKTEKTTDNLENWWYIDGKVDPLQPLPNHSESLKRLQQSAAIHLRDNRDTILTALRLLDHYEKNKEVFDGLVEAGELASDDEFVFEIVSGVADPSYTLACGNGGYVDDACYYPSAPDLEDAKLLAQAANARPAIKGMKEIYDG